MVTCCELAHLALWVIGGAFILALLAMFFNYSLKLDARTVKLEKKNGREEREIERLKAEIEQLKLQLPPHA